uniref:Armadillo repeat-containing domain-containing protein n=1 Tax=Leersia perrieri TaxID=77586 RepID=A0A0D9VVM7_9ORYZ
MDSDAADSNDLLPSSPAGKIHRLLRPCATETDGAITALVQELDSPASSLDDLRGAAMELRLMAKHNPDKRLHIVAAGALPPLVALLKSRADPLLQEHGVTALLNLSLCEENRVAIVDAGAVCPLVRALKSAAFPAARENAACALLRLAQLDGAAAAAIGRAGTVPLLVSLLESGSARGRKDAATALYALCSIGGGSGSENRARAVEAGAVRALLDLMAEPERGMVDKAAYVLHALVAAEAGRVAAVAEGGVPVLVDMVEAGTPRHKEMATLCLLHVCSDSAAYRTMVAREGAIPPLVALSQSSSARPKLRAKAEVLIGLLRQPASGSLVREPPSVSAA